MILSDDDPGWLPADLVAGELQGVDFPLPDDVEQKRAAVVAFVERNRRDLFAAGGLFVPTDDVVAGALMLVGRLHARKGSPQGLASFGEFGASAVLRIDPDVERLLGIGRAGKPVAL